MTELAREYGEGLYILSAEESISAEILEELDSLVKCFKQQPQFLHLLQNMSLEKSERLAIIDNTLRDQVHIYVLNFLKLLCERGIISELSGCTEAFRTKYYQDHDITEAWVTTASPMTDEQRSALLTRLEEKTGHRIVLKEKLDASIIDGILLEMDGKRLDDTLAHRLKEIHSAIVGDH